MSNKNFNAFADVAVEDVIISGVNAHNKMAVKIKDEEGNFQLAGILSRDYNLIKNSIAYETLMDIFSRSQYQFKELKTYFDGKKYVTYQHSVNPIVDNENIKIHLGVMARNSYDGSSKFSLEIFGLNPFCTNQYHSRNRFGFFEIRHTGKEFQLDDAVKNIGIGAQNLMAVAPKILEMKNQPLTIEYVSDAAKKDLIPGSNWGEALAGLEQATIFGLYQSLTAIASKTLDGMSAIKHSNRIGEYFL